MKFRFGKLAGAGLAGLALSLVFALSLTLGSVRIPLKDVWMVLIAVLTGKASAVDPTTLVIVWQLRAARTILAALAGAALGGSGAILQGLFRNPLADPYSLGVSSGASLGAVIAIAGNWSLGLYFISAVELSAFAAAMLTAGLVYLIARSNRRASTSVALLLAGAAVGSFFSALVSLIVSLNDRDLHTVFFWLLGGFGGKSWPDVGIAVMPVVMVMGSAAALAHPLDILGAGEEAAGTLGLNVSLLRLLAVGTASLGAAAAVASGGIIGFIGLLGPHLARLLAGPLHKRFVPVSMAVGAMLLMTADAIARTLVAPRELPVGILTALVGAPLFLRLLSHGGKTHHAEGGAP